MCLILEKNIWNLSANNIHSIENKLIDVSFGNY